MNIAKIVRESLIAKLDVGADSRLVRVDELFWRCCLRPSIHDPSYVRSGMILGAGPISGLSISRLISLDLDRNVDGFYLAFLSNKVLIQACWGKDRRESYLFYSNPLLFDEMISVINRPRNKQESHCR